MLKLIPVLAVALAVLAGCGGNRSLERDAESYLQDLQEFDFRAVCEYYSDKYYGVGTPSEVTPDVCRESIAGAIGFAIAMYGTSPFNTAEWLRDESGALVVEDNKTFLVDCGGVVGAQTVVWTLEDGQYRIDALDTFQRYGDSGGEAPQCTSDAF